MYGGERNVGGWGGERNVEGWGGERNVGGWGSLRLSDFPTIHTWHFESAIGEKELVNTGLTRVIGYVVPRRGRVEVVRNCVTSRTGQRYF